MLGVRLIGRGSTIKKDNRINAFATTMDMLILAFIHEKHKESLDTFDLLFWNTREILRPCDQSAKQVAGLAILNALQAVISLH